MKLLVPSLCGLLIAGTGCGERETPAPPKTEAARASVLSYLEATQSGDFTRACRLLSPEARDTVRTDALGALSPRGSTRRERRKAVRRAFAQASTCEGAVRLRTGQVSNELAAITRAAESDPTNPLGEKVVAIGDDQDWLVLRAGGRWIVDGVNGFSSAG